jgi:hypothetical protein
MNARPLLNNDLTISIVRRVEVPALGDVARGGKSLEVCGEQN